MKPETNNWLMQAKEHYQDMEYLYKGSRYSMAVYCAHQALEKILKAAIVELAGTAPPKMHKLDELAKLSGLRMPGLWPEDLAEITRHFWRVSYPDFQTYTYSSKVKVKPTIYKTREVYLWISERLNRQ